MHRIGLFLNISNDWGLFSRSLIVAKFYFPIWFICNEILKSFFLPINKATIHFDVGYDKKHIIQWSSWNKNKFNLSVFYRNTLRNFAYPVTRTFEYFLVSWSIRPLESHAQLLEFLSFSACTRYQGFTVAVFQI